MKFVLVLLAGLSGGYLWSSFVQAWRTWPHRWVFFPHPTYWLFLDCLALLVLVASLYSLKIGGAIQ